MISALLCERSIVLKIIGKTFGLWSDNSGKNNTEGMRETQGKPCLQAESLKRKKSRSSGFKVT